MIVRRFYARWNGFRFVRVWFVPLDVDAKRCVQFPDRGCASGRGPFCALGRIALNVKQWPGAEAVVSFFLG